MWDESGPDPRAVPAAVDEEDCWCLAFRCHCHVCLRNAKGQLASGQLIKRPHRVIEDVIYSANTELSMRVDHRVAP